MRTFGHPGQKARCACAEDPGSNLRFDEKKFENEDIRTSLKIFFFNNLFFSTIVKLDQSPCFLGGPVAQLLIRRKVESSNQAIDSDKCHRVAKGLSLRNFHFFPYEGKTF